MAESWDKRGQKGDIKKKEKKERSLLRWIAPKKGAVDK